MHVRHTAGVSVPRWFSVLGLGGLVLTGALVAKAGTLKVTILAGELSRDEGSLRPRLQPPKRAPHASNHGGTIAADAQGLWIVERNAGALIRTDHAGELKATIELHAGLGELLLDDAQTSLFVADRSADRVIRFALAGDVASKSAELELIEPHGLALTPDGSTLLVTSVANQELVAVDTATMQIKWRVELAPEPRAVAVSPEGRWALVGFLTSEAVARVELGNPTDGHVDRHVDWHALSPRDHVEVESEEVEWGDSHIVRTVEAGSRFDVPNDIGRRHVRNVFALAFVGDGIAVVAHQLATSQMELLPDAERRDSYGGGAAGIAPIEYRFARIGEPAVDGLVDVDQHDLSVHQPRALAYDPVRDVLYVGGYGDDELAAIGSASRERPTMLWSASLGGGAACGLDGIAIAGEHVWAHCELARRVVRIDLQPGRRVATPVESKAWVRGPELAASLRSDQVERGAELFRRGESFMLGNALACASCHPEGRSDALSWRLGRSILQTPMLAGRVDETGPYKWTGEDSSLRESFAHTLERIGGFPDSLTSGDFSALAAYVTSLPKPRPPSVADPEALARGRALFERDCAICHAGDKTTDRERHEFTTTLRKVDTPSLIGLAHTAPYYHDGSAIDLATLLDDRGSIHDMVDTSGLTADERRDLITFLESL
jgi:cytochrome c553